uniref:Uncharacterized protein n=1 Tax=Trichogramma kaykai TaxID=54128 RepID=A0ABD2XST7_9HYME
MNRVKSIAKTQANNPSISRCQDQTAVTSARISADRAATAATTANAARAPADPAEIIKYNFSVSLFAT